MNCFHCYLLGVASGGLWLILVQAVARRYGRTTQPKAARPDNVTSKSLCTVCKKEHSQHVRGICTTVLGSTFTPPLYEDNISAMRRDMSRYTASIPADGKETVLCNSHRLIVHRMPGQNELVDIYADYMGIDADTLRASLN